MKRALGALAISLLINQICFAKNELTIRSDYWYPMNGTPNTSHPGYMIEIASEIMNAHGYTVNYELMPWARSLKKVAEGKFDCVVGAYKEDARDLLFPEESWGIDQVDFYKLKDNQWQYKSIQSLNNITVGIIGGYAYEESFDEKVKTSEDPMQFQIINENNALELNIRKLLLGRITTTPESIYVMQSKLRQMELTDRVISAGTLTGEEHMYIACSPSKKETKQYLKWFDDGIRKLRATGKLKTILDRYHLKDWKK